MKSVTTQGAATITPRARLERANDEIKTLEGFVVDVRVRPILVVVDAEVRSLRRQIVADANATDQDVDRLDSVEPRLRLLRGTVEARQSASRQARAARA
jgi:hypothetical protein